MHKLTSPSKKIILHSVLAIGLVGMFTGDAFAQPIAQKQTPQLFAELPDDCPTPDGMAIAPDGDLETIRKLIFP